MSIPRFFTNGFKRIEIIGDGCARFTFSETRATPNGVTKRVTAEAIVPLSALSHMIAQASLCISVGDADAVPSPARMRVN